MPRKLTPITPKIEADVESMRNSYTHWLVNYSKACELALEAKKSDPAREYVPIRQTNTGYCVVAVLQKGNVVGLL